MAKISGNIRRFRNEKNMTQARLAELLFVTRQTVSSWETGRTQPDIEMLTALAEALDVRIEELIYGRRNRVSRGADDPGSRKLIHIVLAALGALFLVAGVLVIFIYLYDYIPEAVKRAAVFLPTLAGAAFGVWVFIKKKDSAAFREAACVAWGLGMFVTNGLVSKYTVGSAGYANLLLIDALMLVPLTLIFDAFVPIAAAAVTSGYFIGYTADRYWYLNAWSDRLILTAALAGFLLLIIYRTYRGKLDPQQKFLARWVCVLDVPAAGFLLGAIFSNDPELLLPTVPIAFFLSLYLADRGDKTEFPTRTVGEIGMAVCAAATGIYAAADGSFDIRPGSVEWLEYLPVYALTLAMLVFALRRGGRGRRPTNDLLVAIGAGGVLLCGTLDWYYLSFLLLFTIPFAYLMMLTQLISGVRKASLARLNLGLVPICVTTAGILIAADLGELPNGVMLILLGGALIAVNAAMAKRFGKIKAQKEESEAIKDVS
ncbi:MAG: DUF2157 domain-containing protein [Clostridia bacterium]|nr:DUF2157 domain-containing protein [Clostridia bacterium]